MTALRSPRPGPTAGRPAAMSWEGGFHALLVASPRSGEGKTSAALALAMVVLYLPHRQLCRWLKTPAIRPV